MKNKSTGEFIKELRKEKNMSQQKLAELTRIDRTTITKYETGEREPNYYNLEELSKVLDVSVTELIAGSRTIKDYDKVDNAIKKLFRKMRKFKNIAKVLTAIFVLIIISLIIYIVILNYTATKVYKVYVDNDNIEIINGILVKTKDRMYFTSPIKSLSEDVDKINIYYKTDKGKEYIYNSTKLDCIYFSDKISIKEYNGFNKFIENLFIELESEGKVVEVEQLIVKFDYTNKNVDNRKSNLKQESTEEKDDNKSEIYHLVQNFINNNDNPKYNVKLDKINYEILGQDNGLRISFTKNSNKYQLIYNYNDGKENIYLQQSGKISELVYSYNISKSECETTNCNRYQDDLKLIKSLLEKTEK